MGRAHIGQILKRQGLIDEDQVLSALHHQRKWGGRIGQALVRLRLVKEEHLLAAVGRQLGVPVVHIGDRPIAPAVLRLVPEKLIRQRRVLPLDVIWVRRVSRLIVALPTPQDLRVVDEVAFAAGMDVEPVLAGDDDIERAIGRQFCEPGYEPLELPPVPTEPMRLVDGRRLDG